MTPDRTTFDVVVEYLRASFPNGEIDSQKDLRTGGWTFTVCDAGRVYMLLVSMECLADHQPSRLATSLDHWGVAAELKHRARINLSSSGPQAE